MYMVKIVLIRGAPAVGKTTITKKILKELKVNHKIDCAYICEDDFRKQMQFKYRAKDLIAHKNSVELIKPTILKLLEIDSYDLIFIEGQFRYKEIIEEYRIFIQKNNFESKWMQFELDIEEMIERDINLRNTKSEDIREVKNDIDSFTPKGIKSINTNKEIGEVVQEVIQNII